MIRSNLYDYSDEYIHVKGSIKVQNTVATAAPVNKTNRKVMFKDCALFISFINRINSSQVDDA